jgi:hypothetical protein
MERPSATTPGSIRYKFRRKRFERVEKIIRDILKTQSEATVLDIGGRRDYWDYLEPELRPLVEITLVNFEDELTNFAETGDELRFKTIVGDGCALPDFADNSFDLVHSNSVIEHVGSLANMIKFAAETKRIGKRYYVQTPYLWFPLEPHFGVFFLHWLPSPVRANLTSRFNLGFSSKFDSYAEALVGADEIQIVDKTLMRNLFPDAQLFQEKFALMTKSVISIKA